MVLVYIRAIQRMFQRINECHRLLLRFNKNAVNNLVYAKLIWGIPPLLDDGEEMVEAYMPAGEILKTHHEIQSDFLAMQTSRQSYSVDVSHPTDSMSNEYKRRQKWPNNDMVRHARE